MFKFYRECWDEREDEAGYCYCFESGRPMHGSRYRSDLCCFHHVLEKTKTAYPHYKKTKKNIVIIHPDVHTSLTGNIDLAPKVKKYREYLLSLHNENKL